MAKMKFKGKLLITNNGTIITPYHKGQSNIMEHTTSQYDKVYHKRNEITGFIMKYKGEDSFITHYNNRNFLQSHFPSYELEYIREVIPQYLSEGFSLNNDIVLTDVQLQLARALLKKKEKKEWFINLQTAFGKTLLSAHLISLFNFKSLIMCYDTTILSQWVNTFRTKTTYDTSKILVINSSKILAGIYNDTFDYSKYEIFLVTPTLLMNYAKREGSERVGYIMKILGIGLKIYDEAHRHKGNIVKINALTNIRHTLYLSADFGQANEEIEKLYYKIFIRTEVIKPSKEMIATMKYTNAVVIEFNSKPSDVERNEIFNKYGFSAQLYMDYQFKKNYIFNVLLYTLGHINKTNTNGYKTLILASNIDHVDKIYDFLERKYPDKDIAKYHSGVSPEMKEYAIELANIIVATYKSFGTGIDVSCIKYIISLNQSNKIEDNQAAGRGRPLPDGSFIFYFMIIDKGFSYCASKLKTRLEYLSESKIQSITKIKYVN